MNEEKNEKYADFQEEQGWLSAQTLNKVLHLSDLARSETFLTFDASGKSAGGQTIEIENKIRNFVLRQKDDGTPYLVGMKSKTLETYTADTTFIEAHKAGSLLLDAIYDHITPLYVTYTKDGYAIVHNLLKLKKRPEILGIQAYSRLYQAKENGTKYLLPIEDAHIYNLTDQTPTLIWKPKR